MKRRSFLKSAVSVFPIALSQPFVLGDEPTADLSLDAHVVPAGKDMFGEARSLGFSRITFKTSTQETDHVFIIEHDNLLSGGPALHYHLAQEEWFYVMEGEVVFQVGDKRLRLGVGESVLAPRKVPHAFTAVGDKPAKMLIAFSPAGKMEAYFRDAAKPGAPPMDADLSRKYEVVVVGPPIKA
jgi:mannose-6-phosphate isomerase-like protein (cupin superfamily)